MFVLNYEGAEMKIANPGAELRSYVSPDGREWMWHSDPAVWKGCSPVLFPAIGGLKDGGATIEDRFYAVPRHGFARELDFRAVEQGDDFISFLLEQNAETRKVYPFDFALIVTHRFLNSGFETRFTVENHSSRKMPFLIGGHPGFRCPMKQGERFEDYVLRFEKPEHCGTTLCDGPAPCPSIWAGISARFACDTPILTGWIPLFSPGSTAAGWIWYTGIPARAFA